MKVLSLIGFAFLLSACAMNKSYNITSDPSGAVVSSGNAIYGTTPFTTDLNIILPHRAYDAKPSSSRLLTFSKEGYLSGTYTLQEFSKAGNIHVELVRDKEARSNSSSSSTITADGEDTVEERLIELKSLYDKGLIDEESYQEEEKRILGSI
jgi:hypothetical protein